MVVVIWIVTILVGDYYCDCIGEIHNIERGDKKIRTKNNNFFI